MEITEFQRPTDLLSGHAITVRVMTPDGYESGEKSYPVLYINDGQDVFEDKDILWGECSMDYKNYYASYGRYMPDIIIVALVCPQDRNERTALYSPFTRTGAGNTSDDTNISGKGREYLTWIVNDLKPWIDRTFRTKPQKEYTAVMGYSTGGLFAIYAALSRPDVFTRFAALSSAVYIWKEDMTAFLKQASYRHLQRIYMDVGTNEFGRITRKEEFLMGADMLYHAYLEHGVPAESIKYNIYPGAVHSQTDWKIRFPDAIRWIFP